MKNFDVKKIIFIATVVILAVAFCVSAFMIGDYIVESKKAKEQYEDIRNQMQEAQTATTQAPTETEALPTTGETTEATTEATTEPGMIPGYKALYEQNDDMVGWLRIDGTKLDYPVMQTPDEPDFYLYKDFYKNANKGGSIYAREACNINEPSDNITLYGHNMANGSMFAALNAYTSKQTWENNSLIFFDTLEEYHTYQIFAVFKTDTVLDAPSYFPYHQFVDAENEEEFDKFVARCKELAFYDTGITPKYGDKIICLSTCEYTLENGRLVVAAYRIS